MNLFQMFDIGFLIGLVLGLVIMGLCCRVAFGRNNSHFLEGKGN